MKCWEAIEWLHTGGLSSSAQLHRVRWLVSSLDNLITYTDNFSRNPYSTMMQTSMITFKSHGQLGAKTTNAGSTKLLLINLLKSIVAVNMSIKFNTMKHNNFNLLTKFPFIPERWAVTEHLLYLASKSSQKLINFLK
jgi:hypothetical protein